MVRVWDPTDTGSQPRGKQVTKPDNIWYTPVTGIWQTCWLEPVAAAHITRVVFTADIDSGRGRVPGGRPRPVPSPAPNVSVVPTTRRRRVG